MRSIGARAVRTVCAGGAAVIFVACCSCSGNSAYPGHVLVPGGSPPRSASPPGLRFSLSQINNSFSGMSALRPLAAIGKGSIAVLLPQTAAAPRFAKYDAPYLAESFKNAGLKPSQYSVQMPPGSDQFKAAQIAIAKGARVLIVDTRSSGLGVQIESYAQAHGVPVIDYDWLTLGGTRKYFVGFDSLKVGALLGEGLVNCVYAWRVKHPRIIVMDGANPTNNPSALYAPGYDAVLARQFPSGWKVVSNPPDTWNGTIALGEFRQQYVADKNINAALLPNDTVGFGIITYLQSKGIEPWTFPTTGMDATQGGLQNILAGYQCGTIYKPIYLEAQAAAALAMYVRAKVTPPASLLNGNLTDPQTRTTVTSVLLTPEWVTSENMNSTVVADRFVSVTRLCAGPFASACSAAHISS
jgi:D-xylose transport system substrate-binding protein